METSRILVVLNVEENSAITISSWVAKKSATRACPSTRIPYQTTYPQRIMLDPSITVSIQSSRIIQSVKTTTTFASRASTRLRVSSGARPPAWSRETRRARSTFLQWGQASSPQLMTTSMMNRRRSKGAYSSRLCSLFQNYPTHHCSKWRSGGRPRVQLKNGQASPVKWQSALIQLPMSSQESLQTWWQPTRNLS